MLQLSCNKRDRKMDKCDVERELGEVNGIFFC